MVLNPKTVVTCHVQYAKAMLDEVLTGGMGIVYIAFDHEWADLFAIKTFRPEFLWNEDIINMFVEEAEVWVELDRHENIVQAHFVDRIEGNPCIFLEYIDGTSLQGWITDKQLDVS